MRKNLAKHTAKKLPLAKRVLALCFALIFVCSCLLPAFANGTGVELDTPDTEVVEAADPGTEPEPMDLYDEPAALDDDFAVADDPAAQDDDFAVADEPAAMDDQVEKPVVDDEPAAMDNEVEKPVEGSEPPVADDTPAEEGATKTTTDASGNTVYEYDTSGTTFPGDAAYALPDGDQVLDQMDAAFSIPTNIYHFWLKKMSSYDLADLAADAKTAEMTVEQYLAMYGTDKGCYHIMTAADGANLKDYQFANPTSNDDPEGNSRTFAGWYYTDDLGDEQKFVFDEFLYISEGTTVEVYAKWKAEAKPVTTTAEINALETAVTVDGLAGVDALNVSRMDEDDEDDFVESFADKIDMEKNVDLYAFDLTPVDKNGDTVQPDSGKKATVTIEGFDVTADDTVKVFHKADTGLEDLTSTASVDANGTLTFKTSSFSPFGVVVERAEQLEQEKFEKWYEELVNCSNDVELETLWKKYADEEGFLTYLNSLTSNKRTAIDEKLLGLYVAQTASEDEESGSRIAVYAGNGVTIKTGGSQTLTGSYGYNHEWKSSDESVVTVAWQGNGYYDSNATITGLKADTATITHSWQDYWGRTYKETWYVTVEQFTDNVVNRKAAIYYLALPTGDPMDNAQGQWQPTAGKRPLKATIDTRGAIWSDGREGTGSAIKNKNIITANGQDLTNYITSWPDGSNGKTWTVTKDDPATGYYFNQIWGTISDAYIKSVRKSTGIANLTVNDITKIVVIPRKISRNNQGGENDEQLYHVDCSLSVVGTRVFTAKFWVQDITTKEWRMVDSAQYRQGDAIKQTSKATIGNKADANGIHYVLTGWYTENADGGAYGEDIIPNEKWEDSGTNGAGYMTDSEDAVREDGTVNFYAVYQPATFSDIEITKTITGLFGDREKKFSFVVIDKNSNRQEFKLGHNDSTDDLVGFTEIRVQAGDTLIITETDAGGYTTKAQIKDASDKLLLDQPFEGAEDTAEKTIAIKITEEMIGQGNISINVINDRTATVDNGVLLDTLPYILILVVVAGGGVLLFLRKRKNDDDE